MKKEKVELLLKELKADSIDYKNLSVEDHIGKKRAAIQALMNIRMPRTLPRELVEIQDSYLQEECLEKGIVTLEKIPTIQEKYNSKHAFADMISVWQGDITRLQIDAIVNAANSQMLGCFVPNHRCIDNAIHSAAGLELREACNTYMRRKRVEIPTYEEPTGQAVVTPGFNLPAKYVIHTVGPIVGYRLTDHLRQDLKNCYTSCLDTALEKGLRSIAFCCISTGEFHFPNEEAAKIAVDTVTTFLQTHQEQLDRVIFNVFKDVDLGIYEEILQ